MSTPTRPDGTLADLNGHTHNGRYHSHIGGDQPHNHTADDPGWRGAARIIVGAILSVLSAAGLWVPWFAYRGQVYSISDARGACSSGVGQLAQAFSAQTSAACGQVSDLYDLFRVGLVVGVVLLGWGLLLRRSHP